jgi:hypothetical protein
LQKIGFILLCVILNTQCSVVKKGRINKLLVSEKIPGELLIENVIRQNITKYGFFIKKAEIEIYTKGAISNLIGSLKYEVPDKYLLSLKSKTGLEIARIFISDDTVYVNDRINRKRYFGSQEDLKNKYGIANAILPVILGDFIADDFSERNQRKCIKNKISFDCTIDKIKVEYIIDCNIGKVIGAVLQDDANGIRMEINYSDFARAGEIRIPGIVEMKELKNNITIKIRIKKIEVPWLGKIDFIQGNKYELIRFL